MTGDNNELSLHPPAKLSGAEAQGLMRMLTERRGRDVVLDFGHVRQIGVQCMQVLIAAKATWDADALRFEVRHLQQDMRECLDYCGVDPSLLGAQEAVDDA
ncbi:MAG: STAS domain-containing protein [Pseudomonadota bacterium]